MFSFESRERHVTFVRFLTVFARVTALRLPRLHRHASAHRTPAGARRCRGAARGATQHAAEPAREVWGPAGRRCGLFLRKRPAPAARCAPATRISPLPLNKDSKAFNPGFSLLSSARISFFLSVARTKPPCTELQPSAIESCASSIDAARTYVREWAKNGLTRRLALWPSQFYLLRYCTVRL